jgi:hypothetical protein
MVYTSTSPEDPLHALTRIQRCLFRPSPQQRGGRFQSHNLDYRFVQLRRCGRRHTQTISQRKGGCLDSK